MLAHTQERKSERRITAVVLTQRQVKLLDRISEAETKSRSLVVREMIEQGLRGRAQQEFATAKSTPDV